MDLISWNEDLLSESMALISFCKSAGSFPVLRIVPAAAVSLSMIFCCFAFSLSSLEISLLLSIPSLSESCCNIPIIWLFMETMDSLKVTAFSSFEAAESVSVFKSANASFTVSSAEV